MNASASVLNGEQTKNIWQTFKADNPKLWDELKSSDIDAMVDELVEDKNSSRILLHQPPVACRNNEKSGGACQNVVFV